MEREKVIELVKALGITAEELGIEPKQQSVEKYGEMIREISQMIKGMDIEEEARDNINEMFWEELGITPKKKYKIVRCRMAKTLYQNVYVVMPEDEDEDIAEDYIDDADTIDVNNPDSETDWEMMDCDIYREGLTADEVEEMYDVWNDVNDLE